MYTGSSSERRYITSTAASSAPQTKRRATPEEVSTKFSSSSCSISVADWPKLLLNSTRYCQMQRKPAGSTAHPRRNSFFRYLPLYRIRSHSSSTAITGMNAKAKLGLKAVTTKKLTAKPHQSFRGMQPCRADQQRKKQTKLTGIRVRLKSTVIL